MARSPLQFLSKLLKHRPVVEIEGHDIIILVIGPSGAGKSRLIKAATGNVAAKVGHNLEPCTKKIQIVSCLRPGTDKRVIFVDTPGLHEEGNTWWDVGPQIQRWIETRVPAEQRITGVLYLHRISDKRMTEPPFTDQIGFGNFCGDALGRKICVTTTHWDLVDEQTGKKREEVIKNDYCVTGTTMVRFNGTHDSAWVAVDTLLQAVDTDATNAGSANADGAGAVV